MGNRHVVDGSLDFGQRKDVFHQLDNLCPGKLLDLRGNSLNRAAQIAKAVGALLALALFQMLNPVLKTLYLVLLLCKLRFGLTDFLIQLLKIF